MLSVFHPLWIRKYLLKVAFNLDAFALRRVQKSEPAIQKFSTFGFINYMYMEPVTTVEGLKVIQNPDESRNLLGAYYESLGFHVMKPEAKPAGKPANSAHTAMAGTR